MPVRVVNSWVTWRLVALLALAAGWCVPQASRAATFVSQTAQPLDEEALAALVLESPGEIIAVDDMLFRATDVIESGFVGNPWPGGVLVYSFDASVNATEQSQWLFAAQQWSTVASLSFVQRTTQTNYVRVVDSGPGGSNSSFVGMIGGAQTMNISSWGSTYVIVHEIGHAMGLMHEHQRSDRNTFVTINTANIQPGAGGNFSIASTTNYGGYDFDSVMHYDGCAFSIDCAAGTSCGCTHTTISVLPPNQQWQGQIGQRTHLSYGDHRGMGLRYGCLPPSPPFPISPANGAVGAPATGVFDWTDVGGASSYQLLVSCASGDTAIAAEVTTSLYYYSLPTGTYTWNVRSVNPCGLISPPLAVYSMTISSGPACDPPQALAPTTGADCQPRAGVLRWTAVAAATGYYVRLGDGCGGGSEVFVTAPELAFSGLAANTSYTWQVRPDCACATPGPCFTFTTGDGQAPPAPLPQAPFAGALDQPASGTLVWGAPPEVVEFEVQLGTSCGIGPVYGTDEPSFAYAGLAPGTVHFWRVRTRAACGDWSAYSACRSFSTSQPTGTDRIYLGQGLTLAAGQTLAEIPVRLENPADLRGFELRVRLDTDVFEILGWSRAATRIESAAAVQVDIDPAVGPHLAEFHAVVTYPPGSICPPPFAAGDGPILRLLVNVRPTAALGFTPVALTEGGFISCPGDPSSPSLVSGSVEITAPVLEGPSPAPEWPRELAIRADGPNPARGPTVIRFGLTAADRAVVAVFDLTGREVARLMDEPRTAGWHQTVWDGRGRDGRPVPSGVYLVRVTAAGESRSQRLVRVR